MKRRILSLLLAFLMVLGMIRLPAYAEEGTADSSETTGLCATCGSDPCVCETEPEVNYDGDRDKYVKLNEAVTTFTVCYETVSANTLTFYQEDFQAGSILRITDWQMVEGSLWYRVAFYSGGVIENSFTADFPANPWFLQTNPDQTASLVFVDPCGTCGIPGCTSDHANWCEICQKDDCGQDHTATEPTEPEESVPSISATVTDADGNEQTITVSGDALPEGANVTVSATVLDTGIRNVTDYDISLLVDGVAVEQESSVNVTISGLNIVPESFVKITHYLEDVNAIQNGYSAGTVQIWTDSIIAAQYPDAAAAALAALGMEDTVCVEQFYSTENEVTVSDGSITFIATSFSIYTVTYTGSDAGRAYSVYNDDGGAMNSNGYSSTHEITMDDSGGNTYMLTRGQKFYVDIGPDFYKFGMAAYNWKISSSDLGKFDNGKSEHNGTLANNDEVLTVSSSAPFYTKYTLKVYNSIRTEEINIYVVPEVKLSFDKNIPDGATSNNVTVPATITTVLGDGSTDVRYTRVPVTNPTGTVTGYTFDGWYTAATGGTKVSSGSYVFLDNDNAEYIGGTYSDQYQEILYAHWTPIPYTISYTLNGGSVSTANPTSYNAETATFTLNNPTKTGYSFTGWTGTGLSSASTSVSIAKGSTGNRAYTANWSANPYAYNVVCKSTSGASLGSTTVTYNYGTTNTITPPAIAGYTAPASQSVVWDSTSKTITFTYTPITYTIGYTLNGGEVSTANPTSYNIETNTFTLNNPTKTHYTFAGWTGTGLSSASTSVSIAKGSTGNRTYTANWSPNPYTYDVVYKSTSGESLGSTTVTYNYGTTNTITPPAIAGYTAPASQSVVWDSTSKTITFTYTPITYTIGIENGYDGKLYPVIPDGLENVTYRWFRDSAEYSYENTPWKNEWTAVDSQYINQSGAVDVIDHKGYVHENADTVSGTKYRYKLEVLDANQNVIAEDIYVVNFGDRILNSSFESPQTSMHANLANGHENLFWASTDEYVTESGRHMEVEVVASNHAGFNNKQASLGNQFAEINAEISTSLYQDVVTTPGHGLTWTLGHSARVLEGTDEMFVIITSSQSAATITGQDQVKAMVEAAKTANALDGETDVIYGNITFRIWRLESAFVDAETWTQYAGQYTVPAGQRMTRFFFAAGDTANGVDSYGNLIDGVNFNETIYYVVNYYLNGELVPGASVTGSGTEGEVIKPDLQTFANANNAVLNADSETTLTLSSSKTNVLNLYFLSNYSVTGTIDHGTVTNGTQTVIHGSNSTEMVFTPATGYKITGVTVNDSAQSVSDENSYTYPAQNNVTGPIRVAVTTAKKTYTVTWVDGDGKTLATDTVAYGTTPSYSGATPTKTATDEFSYTFNNTWSPAIQPVTGNATYTAQFNSKVNEYTITWVDGDGNTLKTEEAAYGTTPTYSGATPTKTATAQYTYTWSTTNPWSPAVTTVSGDVTYTAQFDSTVNMYTITWVDGNGNTLDTDTVAYGDVPAYTGATPTKMGNAQYSYTFNNTWSPVVTSVTGNATYTAQFDEAVNKYTITWVDGNGNTLATDTVAYGTTPSYSGTTPTKTATDEFSYTFNNTWSPAVVSVTGDAIYTAQFDSSTRTYTVTWWQDKDEDGVMDESTDPTLNEVLHTDNVLYGTKLKYDGTEPTKAATQQYWYNFEGWEKADGTTFNAYEEIAVTGNATFKAILNPKLMEYYVTWLVEGVEKDKDLWKYGEEPSYSGETPTKAEDDAYTYEWKGEWTPVVVPVVDTVTYEAVFDKIVKTYTISYNLTDENGRTGTVVGTNPVQYTVESGEITLINPTPDKPYYKFVGWTGTGLTDKTMTVTIPTGSTGNREYTANYELIEYQISFYTNGAEKPKTINPITYKYGDNVTLPTVTKEGYTYKWKVHEADGDWTAGAEVVSGVMNHYGNVTLKAEWTANPYEIRFHKNADDATGEMANLDMTYDVAKNLTANAFLRTGYTFKGWATTPTGTVTYEDQEAVKNLTAEKDEVVELYAVWEINTVSLIIRTSSLDTNQSYVFQVAGTGLDGTKIELEVVLDANDSQTIVGLPAGTYTITNEQGWSWRYEAKTAQKDVHATTEVVEFSYTDSQKIYWLNGYGNQQIKRKEENSN